jgi:glycyl-tRNA synthetase alpha chain
MNKSLDTSFQNIVFKLQKFWSDKGCSIIQPLDSEVGAGTLHPMTALKALGNKAWNVSYIQPCRRPTDARYAKNPNRLSHYYQFQTLLKPAPKNIKELYLESLNEIGLNVSDNDVRFVEDDWENPSVGASGLGWEIWYNGMEISQFTYMQQIGGIECDIIPGEITYGLERIIMHIQGVNSIFDINWNGQEGDKKVTYGDIFKETEIQNSHYVLDESDIDILFTNFRDFQSESQKMIDKKLPFPAYELALKSSHILNLLDARGAISVNERASYIFRIRNLVRQACELAKENN